MLLLLLLLLLLGASKGLGFMVKGLLMLLLLCYTAYVAAATIGAADADVAL